MMKSQQSLLAKVGTGSLPLSQKINKLQRILLFIFLLVVPFQFGKHFWPSFAFVSGQRVDYLSPAVYASDVAVILLFLFAFFQKQLRMGRLGMLGGLGLLLYLSFETFFSVSPLNGWYFLLKILEMAFLVWYIASLKKGLSNLLFWAFDIDVLLEGVLGVAQFVHQGSIGGLWYFLGERTFSAATPGIANASIRGQLILRPYATFPHPNVFAGFLVITLLFFLQYIFMTKALRQKIAAAIVLLFGFCILLLTLSRVAIVVFILLSFLFVVLKFAKINRWMLLGICVLGFVIFLSPLLSGRFLDLSGYVESLQLRDVLMQAAWSMFASHPVFGVGLGNFLPSLPYYISPKILFGFLQPVHNIFLLVLAETGIIGLVIFLSLLVFAFAKSLKKVKSNSPYSFSFFALLAICLIGMTDHYFLTLQQGQLLLALALGIAFNKSPKLLK